MRQVYLLQHLSRRIRPVSIKMAKQQNLSLNPVKISGLCGRLMCCLRFESDSYDDSTVKYPDIVIR